MAVQSRAAILINGGAGGIRVFELANTFVVLAGDIPGSRPMQEMGPGRNPARDRSTSIHLRDGTSSSAASSAVSLVGQNFTLCSGTSDF